MSFAGMVEAVAASSLSELAWVDGSGAPEVRGTVALLRGDVPVLAFTYADAPVASAVAAAAQVTLSLTESRSTGRGFAPLLLRGRPRLVPDPAGTVFTDELLDQELRRFPPARVLADSPLLRREHWWYLPRLLVEIDVDSVQPIPVRSDARDHLLVVAGGDGPEVVVAGSAEESPEQLSLDVREPPVRPTGAGRAVLFGQDASFPDLERWSQWRYRGTFGSDTFEVHEAPARVGLGPAPGVRTRWRRQRQLEKQCRQAIPGT